MHRLFVAIRPPAAVREALSCLMEGVEGARWQDDDQLHLTLRFIGEVETRMAEDIVAALSSVRSPPLDLRVQGVGTFERRGRADTLWAGVTPREGQLALHRKIDHVLVGCGLSPETRSYAPHITLARLGRMQRGLPDFIVRHNAFDGGSFTAKEFGLYTSEIAKDGARYERVARYGFAG